MDDEQKSVHAQCTIAQWIGLLGKRKEAETMDLFVLSRGCLQMFP